MIRCAVLGVSQGHSFSQRISVIVPAKANVQRHQVGMISVRVVYVVEVYSESIYTFSKSSEFRVALVRPLLRL